MWEHDEVVQRRFLLSGSVNAGLLALLLLLGAVVGPLSMWMLERHTLATSPKADHYFVEGCAGQTNVVIFVPWGLVGLVIVAFLLGARSRTVGIPLTSLVVGWQVPMVWLIFDLGVGWCGDPDGASLVRDATPGWLGPVWLAWLVLGVALGVSHVVALIRFPVSPQQPAERARQSKSAGLCADRSGAICQWRAGGDSAPGGPAVGDRQLPGRAEVRPR